MIASICRATVPVVWRLLRWMERHSGAALIPDLSSRAAPSPTATAHGIPAMSGADLLRSLDGPLSEAEVCAAFAAHPGVDSIVRADGLILWQGGQGLRAHRTWQAQRLPKTALTARVLRDVVDRRSALQYDLIYEGIRYAGIAYPWQPSGHDDLCVVFRAVPTSLPVFALPVRTDERLRAIQGLAEEAQAIVRGGEPCTGSGLG